MFTDILHVQAKRVLDFLDENIMTNFINSFRKFYSKDIFFLMSFPRSGNGWIRYLITEALLVSKGIDLEDSKRSTYIFNNINAHCIITKSGRSFGIEDFFPDYYAIDKENFRNKYSKECFFKPNNAYIKTHHLVFRKDVNIVHLYRNPKEAFISYFNLLNLTNDIISFDKNNEEFANFFKQSIKNYLNVYYKMLSFYLDKINKKVNNVLLLKMEDMVSNSSESFDNLLEFLKINITAKEKAEILERNPKIKTTKKETIIALEDLWDEELVLYEKNIHKFYFEIHDFGKQLC